MVRLMGKSPSDGALAEESRQKAEATLQAMTRNEKTVLTHGMMAMTFVRDLELPDDALPGAGYVSGIPRLGVPALRETDGCLGVSWVMGLRKDGATALPSGLALASTWNPDLVRSGGVMIGSEARAKGFNVMLAGGANLTREPRNGRTFEYLSEDPLLTGTLVGAMIGGIQSNGIISTIKHFALNCQESGRNYIDVRICESAARESDLLAFQIGIEIGKPLAVMGAYNLINGHYACNNDWLLNKVLKTDWRWKGYVMSDWGAVSSLEAAVNGLDQQSGAQLDPEVFFKEPLAFAAEADPVIASRLDDMNRRILTSIYVAGLDREDKAEPKSIDYKKNEEVALELAKQGIVLLVNHRHILPLGKRTKTIAIIGGYADTGVLSGAGASQVHNAYGPAVSVSRGGTGPLSVFMSEQYHSSAPVSAIRELVPEANIIFRDGRYILDAVAAARRADVAIVFATKWSGEGSDQPDLTLPNGQDSLIAAVAAANPLTVVVLETGNPIVMPWLDDVAAVLQAWYPGVRGGEAIASVLFGDTNPSGHLPITFPASVEQLPRPLLDGYDIDVPPFGHPRPPECDLTVNYDIEGSDVGYRWYARENLKPLFPFGFGLSYTTFNLSDLASNGEFARFVVHNTGRMQGSTVAQVYLKSRNGEVKTRLVGFERIDLAPGDKREVTVMIDPRLLADWRDGRWWLDGGEYLFALGEDASNLASVTTVTIRARHWMD